MNLAQFVVKRVLDRVAEIAVAVGRTRGGQLDLNGDEGQKKGRKKAQREGRSSHDVPFETVTGSMRRTTLLATHTRAASIAFVRRC